MHGAKQSFLGQTACHLLVTLNLFGTKSLSMTYIWDHINSTFTKTACKDINCQLVLRPVHELIVVSNWLGSRLSGLLTGVCKFFYWALAQVLPYKIDTKLGPQFTDTPNIAATPNFKPFRVDFLEFTLVYAFLIGSLYPLRIASDTHALPRGCP